MIKGLTLALLLAATTAQAQSCPPLPDRSAERRDLLKALRFSPDPAAGVEAANAVWAFWTTAPDETAQDMLDRGMAAMRDQRPDIAESILEDLVAYCPDFAEGWNQRAFARFLNSKLDASLEDIAAALKLEPVHFGALSGRAMILVRQGRSRLAQIALRRAVLVHPWLSERQFLEEIPGQEL